MRKFNGFILLVCPLLLLTLVSGAQGATFLITVHAPDGSSIEGACVNLLSSDVGNACQGTWLNKPFYYDEGVYTIEDVPEGTFYVYVSTNCPPGPELDYVGEWWDGEGGQGSLACQEAEAVTVQAGDTLSLTFTLAPGEWISGTVTDEGGQLLEQHQGQVLILERASLFSSFSIFFFSVLSPLILVLTFLQA